MCILGFLQVNNQLLPQENFVVAGSAAVSFSGSTLVADEIYFNGASIDFQDNPAFIPCHSSEGIVENQSLLPPVLPIAASSSSVLDNKIQSALV